MTTNQTIDGVSRDLLEGIMYNCMFSLSRQQYDELTALLDAPAVAEPLSVPDECPHLIVFDDTEREQLMFSGTGAREAALKTWKQISNSWNAHLFVRVERNSRDDRYPSAGHKPAAQPQGEPVAWSFKEYVWATGLCSYVWRDQLESDRPNEKEREVLEVVPLYAEQPAPVAVVMSFEFEHPFSKEKRTVTLSKQDVFHGMEDYFYDKLAEQICQCESVGETNVIDCNCDEYVHDFEIVRACLDEVTRLNGEKP